MRPPWLIEILFKELILQFDLVMLLTCALLTGSHFSQTDASLLWQIRAFQMESSAIWKEMYTVAVGMESIVGHQEAYSWVGSLWTEVWQTSASAEMGNYLPSTNIDCGESSWEQE